MTSDQSRLARPARLGFRMPAEWEPHSATWLAWPHNHETWPGVFSSIPDVYVKLVTALHRAERVRICVNAAAAVRRLRRRLVAAGVDVAAVDLFEIPTNDAWTRDHGPIFITRRRAAGVASRLSVTDWAFNAWGAKYPPWDLDDAVPRRIAERLGLTSFTPGMVLEGGSIEVNGSGLLLTTEACLLNPNRNPHLTRADIEQTLRDYLGVQQIGWLGEGILGDDTDGHVDDIVRFVNPNTVVCAVEDETSDPNFAPLRDNLRRLQSLRDRDGKPLRVVPLPMPAPLEHDGRRVPASYANFYITNGSVLVPTFGQPTDLRALSILEAVFPGRRVEGIPCRNLVIGLGGLHCITMQQPAGEPEQTIS